MTIPLLVAGFIAPVLAEPLQLGEWHVEKASAWNPDDMPLCLSVAEKLNARAKQKGDGLLERLAARPAKMEVPIKVVSIQNSDDNATYLSAATGLPVYRVSDTVIVRMNEGAQYRPNNKLIIGYPQEPSQYTGVNLRSDYLICGNGKPSEDDPTVREFDQCITGQTLPLDASMKELKDDLKLVVLPDSAWIESAVLPANTPNYYQADALVAVTSSVYFEDAPDSPVQTDKDHPARIALLRLNIHGDSGNKRAPVNLQPLSCVVEAKLGSGTNH